VETKVCRVCGEEKTLDSFKKYHSLCSVCYANKRKYNRELNRAKSLEYLHKHPCIYCGNAEIDVLCYNHRDPGTKHKNIGLLLEGRWSSVENEIAKCDVLCRNCHVKLHKGDGHVPSKIPEKLGSYTGILKVCRTCNIAKDSSLFADNRNVCRKCRQVYTAKARAINKARVHEYLESKGCRCCGLSDPEVLELHHDDPSVKEYTVSHIYSYNWDNIQKEINKCSVLCSNCHRKLHSNEVS
jgi:hypothetical protein